MKSIDIKSNQVFDWESVDWECVDIRKSKFIYREGQAVNREIIETHNRFNEKALSFLLLVLPLVVIVATMIFTRWEYISSALRWAAVTFISLGTNAAIQFIAGVWPRAIGFSASEPESFFAKGHYQLDLSQLMQGLIIKNAHAINKTYRAIEQRRSCIIAGLVLLLLTILLPPMVFLLIRIA